MTAFDQAWQIIKMARHIISDDIEFWDPLDVSWDGGGSEYRPIPKGYEKLEQLKPPLGEMPEDYGWMDTIDWDNPIQDEEGNYKARPTPKENWRLWAGNLGDSRESINPDGMNMEWGYANPDAKDFNDRGYGRINPVVPKRGTPFTAEEIYNARAERWNEPQNHYYPIGSSTPGDNMAKVMMRPSEFLGLASNPQRDDRNDSSLDYLRDLIERNREGGGRTPLGMPWLEVMRTGIGGKEREGVDGKYDDQRWEGPHDDFKAVGHEGRHRMQTLIDMGLDDPVPTLVSPTRRQKHSWGRSKSTGRHKGFESAILGSKIRPQGSRWLDDPNWRKQLPKDRKYSEGIHPNSRSLRVDDVNPIWGKGIYDDLRRG